MKNKLLFSVLLAATVALNTNAQTTTCDEFNDPLWEGINDSTIAGYTQDGTYPIEATADWYNFVIGQGYWTGELTFNFSGAEQEAVFTIFDYCEWEGVTIVINGSTTVPLMGSFPLTIDGFTIDKTDLPSEEGSKAEISVSGEFTTILIDGCETIIEDLCVTLEEEIDMSSITENQLFEIEVYPNPASDQVRINSVKTIRSIELYSISGQLVQSTQANNKNIQIDIADLNKGIYMLHITTADGLIGIKKLAKD